MSVDQIINYIDAGSNVLMHGCGGTGKSYTIRQLALRLQSKGITCWCVATTGIAAVNLGAPGIKTRTLHSWSGIGLGDKDAHKLYAKVNMNDRARERWTRTKVLIIDEVSMLGESLITKLDFIGRKIRGCPNRPFGGLQIIASGDFLQLPPVKDDWAFSASVWPELDFVAVPFIRPMRYDDLDWFQLLLRVRRGQPTDADILTLQKRVDEYDEYQELLMHMTDLPAEAGEADSEVDAEADAHPLLQVRPTMIYSLKRDVGAHNMSELGKLPGTEFTYNARDAYKKLDRAVRKEAYEKMLDEAMKPCIKLKIGAQVMLKANMDIDRGLVNGSRGVVIRCETDAVFVKFCRIDKPVRVAYHTWTVEDDRMIASRSQLPFILAWASTVHSSQGCTLDCAVCDLGSSIFADGQAYVALSRVRNLSGLYLKNLHPSVIKANPEALSYVQSLSSSVEKIAFVGTSPHLDEMLSRTSVIKLCAALASVIPNNAHLFCDVGTIAGRIAIDFYLARKVAGLTMHFPSSWDTESGFTDTEFNSQLDRHAHTQIRNAIDAGANARVMGSNDLCITGCLSADRIIVFGWGDDAGSEAGSVLNRFTGCAKKYINLLMFSGE